MYNLIDGVPMQEHQKYKRENEKSFSNWRRLCRLAAWGRRGHRHRVAWPVAAAAVRRYASPKKINGKWRGIGPLLIGAQSPVLWHHLSKGVNGLLPKDYSSSPHELRQGHLLFFF